MHLWPEKWGCSLCDQTAESETMEVPCNKCQPHFLEDRQTLMQLRIRSAVHRISPPSSGYTMSFSTSRDNTYLLIPSALTPEM